MYLRQVSEMKKLPIFSNIQSIPTHQKEQLNNRTVLFKLLANPNLKFVRVYALISKSQNYRERLRGSARRYLEQELGLFYLFLVFWRLQVQHR